MQNISNEILEKYQVRKTRPQKTAFIEFMKTHFPDLRVEEGGFGKNRNIVVGDISKAKVVFTAHYDTCARLPFPNFITPKNMLIYILYAVLIAIPFILLMALTEFVLVMLSVDFTLAYFISVIVLFGSMLYVFMLGTPNKHTANDNTSGVVSLCELMLTLPTEEVEKCAFVFFDNEENGLLGSAFFAKLHKSEMAQKLLINLDCVGDGDNIMFVINKKAALHRENLVSSFEKTGQKQPLFEKSSSAFYPSDQVNFKVSVAVASLKKKPVIGYYMDKIHTKHDTVCEEENIKYLCQGFSKFLKKI